MFDKIRASFGLSRDLRSGSLDASVRETFAREEETGARALLYLRLLIFVLFIVGGVTASPNIKDAVSNLIFAAGYGAVLILQWLLLKGSGRRALHRFAYFMILADYALFTGLLIFYYNSNGNGNFNHVLKSPYMVLLLVPIMTTLMQFRQKLMLFSLVALLCIIVGLFGFAKLSGAPQTTDWHQYILGNAIIYSAWLGVWILIPFILAAIVGYAIFRSLRMVANIGNIDAQRKQLTRYFSPSVVEEITQQQNGSDGIKSGERRQVAVLFADIRSFTALSENLPPDDVAQLLTQLRSLQIRTVFQNQGMVDKFIGDAIMAVFGAPHSAADFKTDVTNAVRCGIAMHSALAEFNAERRTTDKSEIRIGIGIHAGEAFAGNLGDDDRLEYTVIGDVVNTASRIEHLCKKAQADFLVSEIVAAQLPDDFQHEKVGLVKIRGKETAMAIFKILHGSQTTALE